MVCIKINKNKTHCHAHFWNQLTKSLQRQPIFCNEYYKAELLTKSPRILSYFLSILQPRIYRRTWLIYDNSVCSIGIFLTSSTLIAELTGKLEFHHSAGRAMLDCDVQNLPGQRSHVDELSRNLFFITQKNCHTPIDVGAYIVCKLQFAASWTQFVALFAGLEYLYLLSCR